MTIDEKRIFELEMKYCGEDVSLELAELTEVFRLARLGLQTEVLTNLYGTPEGVRIIKLAEWAEKEGIPALTLYTVDSGKSTYYAKEALKHLPQEGENK